MSTPTPNFSGTIAALPWYEKAIAAVAPSYALRRLEARVQRTLFAYQAAQADRLYSPKTWGVPSESSGTARDRVTMMWEALDLVENFPLAGAVCSKYGTFLTPTEYAPNTGDRDYDALISEYFHDWCKRCDVTGRHSFRKLVQLAVEMRPAYGDCGVALRRTDAGLKLQLISGDRIGNPNEASAGELGDGHYNFSGVIANQYGAPIAYRVYCVDTSGQYSDPEDIAASDFFHYFDPFRVDQYRGVTDFHAVARTMRMLKEILEAEQVGVRFASQQAALVFNERGQAPTRNVFTPSNAANLANGERPQHEQTDIGTIRYLYTGDRVETMPARPGTAFSGFVQTLMADIALGLKGYPAGVLWGTQDFKGPSVRAEFAQADRVNTRHQGILCDKLLDPIKNPVILDAIATGALPAPPASLGSNYAERVIRATRGTFRFPPRLTIDVGRESAARISELLNGANSLSEIAAEDGKDAYTRLEEKAQTAKWVAELAEKYDVPETAIILPGGQLPSTPAAAAAVGEKAGEDAAEAQAGSVAQSGGQSAAKPSEDGAEGDDPADMPAEMSRPRTVAEALAGPTARKRARTARTAERMKRLESLRGKFTTGARTAEQITATFERLNN